MATFYTSQGTLQNDEVDAKRASGELLHGRLRVATVQYTSDGTQAENDIIRLVKFDHPVTIHPELSSVHASAAMSATACTLDIGDDSEWTAITPDADRYADGLDLGAAGIDLFTAPAVPAAVGTPYTTTEGGWLDATIATLTGAAASGVVLTFRIVYSIN
jgi:hypothetical protein